MIGAKDKVGKTYAAVMADMFTLTPVSGSLAVTARRQFACCQKGKTDYAHEEAFR